MPQAASRRVGTASLARLWLVPLLCAVWSCDTPPALEAGSELKVGRRQDSVLGGVPAGVAQELPPVSLSSRALERERAVAAWRATPGEQSAQGLAQALFPEYAASQGGLSPDKALQVKRAPGEGGAVELSTRGYAFSVQPVEGGAGPRVWSAAELGARVEEYQVLEEGQGEWRTRYEVAVPPGIEAVREAEGYVELVDRGGVPVLRLHAPEARSGEGRARQGELKLRGVAAQGRVCGGRQCYALIGSRLQVELVLELEGLSGPVVLAVGWSSAAAMATGRYLHSLTVLSDGRVLAAGGTSGSTAIPSAEVYDPSTGTWSATGSLVEARYIHTATVLPNGQMLAVGGRNSTTRLATAEVYNPATGTWSAAGATSTSRTLHTATLLANGRVLVVGGLNASDTASSNADLYDPATGTWSSAAPVTSARYGHTATLLANGNVLVAGGTSGSASISSAAVYTASSNTWATTGSLSVARDNHTAVLLTNGRVLVVGGQTGTSPLSSTELYDPATGTWSSTGTMSVGRVYHTMTLLPNGRVLAVGGYSSVGTVLSGVEAYNPATGTWSATSSLLRARQKITHQIEDNRRATLIADFRPLCWVV